ncbi:glutathione S-transferase [Cyathus striatus]|nr:glutathione S-transferase [Cyathus striatus]
MVLKLYGVPESTCAKRVAVVLHEKKVPYELISVDYKKGEHKTPEYLNKWQPFGQVPSLDDDGFIVYESRAIARYIATKYASQGTPELIPLDLKKQALFEQAASVETSNFDPYASQAVSESVFKKSHGLVPDPEKFKYLIETLSTKLDVYDQILAKQRYVAGDELTLADLFHLSYGEMLAVAGSDIMQQKPNVARWFNEIISRPSWEAVKNGPVSMASYD